MDSNTLPSRPKWLNDRQIAELRKDILACPNPYSQEEVLSLELDDPNFNIERYDSYFAKKILTKYGIPLTDDEEKTEQN